MKMLANACGTGEEEKDTGCVESNARVRHLGRLKIFSTVGFDYSRFIAISILISVNARRGSFAGIFLLDVH